MFDLPPTLTSCPTSWFSGIKGCDLSCRGTFGISIINSFSSSSSCTRVGNWFVTTPMVSFDPVAD